MKRTWHDLIYYARVSWLAGMCVALTGGCQFNQPHTKTAPPVALPTHFMTLPKISNHETNSSMTAQKSLPEAVAMTAVEPPRNQTAARWWEAFQDAELNRLVTESLAGNFGIRRAWERLAAATATVGLRGAALFPSLDGEANASRTRSDTFIDATNRYLDTTVKQLSMGLVAAYEVDLWRRVRNTRDAARYDAQASREDINAAAISLASQVASAWFTLLEERARLNLLREQDKTNKTFLRLTKLRFGQGLTTAVDVHQQQQQLYATRQEIPLTEAAAQVLKNRLAVLLGLTPNGQKLSARDTLPPLPPLPNPGLPMDLLTQRPDVRAAYLRLAAADYRLAATVADRLPALRLTGRLGQQAADTSRLFSSWLWNLAGGLTAPILDGGRRAEAVRQQDALRREALLAWGEMVLRAIREVEDAAVRENRQHAHIAEMDKQLASSSAAVKATRRRYVNGQTDFLPVLTALNTHQRLARARLRMQGELLRMRVTLATALGGSWTNRLTPRAQITLRDESRPAGETNGVQ